jgi:hypothetical protein
MCLALVLILALLPGRTLAADASGVCGSDLRWELNGTKLTVSGSGNMDDYAPEKEAPWFEYRYKIEQVEIGDGVTSIGDYAFSELESLTLAEVGGVERIGDYAFYSCVSLVSVRMSSGVKTVGDYAFAECYDLSSAVISDTLESIGESAFMNTSLYGDLKFGDDIKEIGAFAFSGCQGLSSVTLPDSVESVGDFAFYNCEFIGSVTVGRGLSSIGKGAFSYCSELKTVTVDSENTAFTTVSGALLTADGKTLVMFPMDMVTSVAIPETVTTIGSYAFAGSYVLDHVTLPEGLEVIGECAFADCWALDEITIPGTVKSIGDLAFASAYGIGSIDIPASVSEIGDGAFLDMGGLTSFSVAPGNDSFSAADGILYNYDKTTLIACPGGKTGSVTLPKTVTKIAPYGFFGCGITSVSLPSGLREIGDEAFESCTGLTGMEIPRDLREMGESVFLNCPSLGSITVDSGNTYFRERDGVLFTYDMMELVCFPAGKTAESYEIPNGVFRIQPYAFAYSTVKSVAVPDSVNIIDTYAFLLCEQLTDIDLGRGVTEVGEYAFSDCMSLERLIVPAGVARLGNYAFAWCYELETLVFMGETYIGARTFSWCPELSEVRFKGAAPGDIDELAFYGSEEITLIYTVGAVGWTSPTWKGYSTAATVNGDDHRGDINNDGGIDNSDLILLARYVVNLVTFDYGTREAADYNGDGKVNNVDLIGVARYIVRL